MYDIIIVGGGIVGATTALALAKNTSLRVALIDRAMLSSEWVAEKSDFRVSAISLASKQIFSNLNVWEKMLNKRVNPYFKMHVWEEASTAKLEFDSLLLPSDSLGYIIEDNVMRSSLIAALRETSVTILEGTELNTLSPIANSQKCHPSSDSVQLVTSNGELLTTRLLIAADGANSWVRTQADFKVDIKPYNQNALVTTVKTSVTHQQTAWQCFLKTGPLAFLPLTDPTTASIVWSHHSEQTDELLNLDDGKFNQKLGEAFEHKLGQIVNVDKRYYFPLQRRHAKNYVQARIALVGDAAHTLHPLAGQGVNLGLLDAACLVHVIQDALQKKRDFSSLHTLRKYERWRKGDNLIMISMVDFLKHIFTSEKSYLQTLRKAGLNFTDRTSFLKKIFMNHALGLHDDLPELARE